MTLLVAKSMHVWTSALAVATAPRSRVERAGGARSGRAHAHDTNGAPAAAQDQVLTAQQVGVGRGRVLGGDFLVVEVRPALRDNPPRVRFALHDPRGVHEVDYRWQLTAGQPVNIGVRYLGHGRRERL